MLTILSKRRRRMTLALALAAPWTPGFAQPTGPAADAAAALVPLRVVLVAGNPAQAVRDPATGQLKGVAVDVALALARSEGRTAAFSTASPSDILARVASGEADFGFVAPNPQRVGQVLYSQPYMLVQQSAIVPASSPATSVKDLDRDGQAIGANTGDSVAVHLRANHGRATVTDSADMSLREALDWLSTGKVAAFAGNRQRLGAAIQERSGFRLLPDNFYGVPQAVAVGPGAQALLSRINLQIDALRNSGELAAFVRRSGADGIAVAPPR